ncbi:MAG: hypothetical protein ACKVP7_27620 [Hyphomicrobiaceae bacterium]
MIRTILKTTAVALAALFIVATTGAGDAEARGGRGHGFHGGGHHFRHHFVYRAPIYTTCYRVNHRRVCNY